MLGEVVGWCHKSKKLLVQCYNQMGDKDGKPLAENWHDLWAFPTKNTTVHLDDKEFAVREYITSVNMVELAQVRYMCQ